EVAPAGVEVLALEIHAPAVHRTPGQARVHRRAPAVQAFGELRLARLAAFGVAPRPVRDRVEVDVRGADAQAPLEGRGGDHRVLVVGRGHGELDAAGGVHRRHVHRALGRARVEDAAAEGESVVVLVVVVAGADRLPVADAEGKRAAGAPLVAGVEAARFGEGHGHAVGGRFAVDAHAQVRARVEGA